MTKLPRELRDEIYSYLVFKVPCFNGKRTHGVLLANKQMAAEIQDILRRADLTIYSKSPENLTTVLRSGCLSGKINNRYVEFRVRIKGESVYHPSGKDHAKLTLTLHDDHLTLNARPYYQTYFSPPWVFGLLNEPVSQLIGAVISATAQERIQRTEVILPTLKGVISENSWPVMEAWVEHIVAKGV